MEKEIFLLVLDKKEKNLLEAYTEENKMIFPKILIISEKTNYLNHSILILVCNKFNKNKCLHWKSWLKSCNNNLSVFVCFKEEIINIIFDKFIN